MSNLTEQWNAAQEWEREWWLNNPQMHEAEVAKGEYVKSLLCIHNTRSTKVLDVGCGPLSLLLRTPVAAGSVALDPLDFGHLEARYKAAGITRVIGKGEDFDGGGFDEAWIYNCLQHTEDPALVVAKAAKAAKLVRVFEWINIPPYQGHLHMITPETIRLPLLYSGMKPLVEFTGQMNMGTSQAHLVGEFCVSIYEH